MVAEILLKALTAGAVAVAKKFAPDVVREGYYALRHAVLKLTNYSAVVEEAFPNKEADLTSKEAKVAQVELLKKLENMSPAELDGLKKEAESLLVKIGQAPKADVIFKGVGLEVSNSGSVEIDNRDSSVSVNLDGAKVGNQSKFVVRSKKSLPR